MSTKHQSFLVVEDNPDDEALILRALKKANISNIVDVVHDGAEALDYLFRTGSYVERSSDPSVVLLDIHLPKVSGLEVLERLRADPRTKNLPVIILTSSEEDEDRIRSYELGVNSIVHKSVNSVKFSEAIRELGLYWVLVDQPPPEKY